MVTKFGSINLIVLIRIAKLNLPRRQIELCSGMKTIWLISLAGLLLTGCATRTYTTAAPPLPAGPSLAEVQTLVQAKVGDAIIVSQIQNSSTRYFLTADQIIALKTAGASDAVINALITTASKPPVQTTTTVIQQPYVYPSVYVDPWPSFWWGWGPYYHGNYRGGGYYHGGGHYRHGH